MRYQVAAALVVCAIAYELLSDNPNPTPQPTPVALDLAGSLQGETAASDAITLAEMADEIANVIEWDGQREEPVLTTGFALDKFRTSTREFLCRGESLGDRHPELRERVAAYLDEQLGDDGGDLTPEQRENWVDAYRVIARSARALVE